MLLALRPRPSALRCAYCHESIDEASCEECGTALHAECLKAIGFCPTLGCGKEQRVPIRVVVRRNRRVIWEWVGAVGILAAVAAFVAFDSLYWNPLGERLPADPPVLIEGDITRQME